MPYCACWYCIRQGQYLPPWPKAVCSTVSRVHSLNAGASCSVLNIIALKGSSFRLHVQQHPFRQRHGDSPS